MYRAMRSEALQVFLDSSLHSPDDLGWLRAAERDLATNTGAPWTCPAQFVQPGASVGLAQGYGALASTGGLLVSY